MSDMVRLTGTERKVLAQMAMGRKLVTDARGGFRVGSQACRADMLDRLRRHDLVEARGEGFAISGPGMAHAARRDAKGEAAELPNRMIVHAADGARTKDAARSGARSANQAEEPLAWLYARGKICERQYDAGERLRRDHMLAGHAPQVTMSWDAGPIQKGRRGAPDGLSPTERQVAAKARLNGALAAAGAGLADVLTRMVCDGEGLETAERAMGWPARSGKVVLCLGLDRVADYYRL